MESSTTDGLHVDLIINYNVAVVIHLATQLGYVPITIRRGVVKKTLTDVLNKERTL